MAARETWIRFFWFSDQRDPPLNQWCAQSMTLEAAARMDSLGKESELPSLASFRSVGPHVPGAAQCGVCLSHFTEENAATLDCNHLFCYGCLIKLLSTRKNQCPTCRQPINGLQKTDIGRVMRNSQSSVKCSLCQNQQTPRDSASICLSCGYRVLCNSKCRQVCDDKGHILEPWRPERAIITAIDYYKQQRDHLETWITKEEENLNEIEEWLLSSEFIEPLISTIESVLKKSIKEGIEAIRKDRNLTKTTELEAYTERIDRLSVFTEADVEDVSAYKYMDVVKAQAESSTKADKRDASEADGSGSTQKKPEAVQIDLLVQNSLGLRPRRVFCRHPDPNHLPKTRTKSQLVANVSELVKNTAERIFMYTSVGRYIVESHRALSHDRPPSESGNHAGDETEVYSEIETEGFSEGESTGADRTDRSSQNVFEGPSSSQDSHQLHGISMGVRDITIVEDNFIVGCRDRLFLMFSASTGKFRRLYEHPDCLKDLPLESVGDFNRICNNGRILFVLTDTNHIITFDALTLKCLCVFILSQDVFGANIHRISCDSDNFYFLTNRCIYRIDSDFFEVDATPYKPEYTMEPIDVNPELIKIAYRTSPDFKLRDLTSGPEPSQIFISASPDIPGESDSESSEEEVGDSPDIRNDRLDQVLLVKVAKEPELLRRYTLEGARERSQDIDIQTISFDKEPGLLFISRWYQLFAFEPGETLERKGCVYLERECASSINPKNGRLFFLYSEARRNMDPTMPNYVLYTRPNVSGETHKPPVEQLEYEPETKPDKTERLWE